MQHHLPARRNSDTPLTGEQVAALQGIRSVASVEEMRADIWESDAEVDAFIEDVRRTRRQTSPDRPVSLNQWQVGLSSLQYLRRLH